MEGVARDTRGTSDQLNEMSFDNLVTCYRQPLLAAAYHLSGNRETAQDIVQETLIAAYQGFESLRDVDRVGAWLFTILRRRAGRYHHSKRPEVELTENISAPCPEDAEAIVREIIHEQMAQLPDEDREILAGKYLLGLSYEELAESLGVKEATIRVRCFRAKERMRKALEGTGIRGEKHGV